MDEEDDIEGAGGSTPTVLVGAVALAIGAIVGIVVGFVSGTQGTPEPASSAEVEVAADIADVIEAEDEDDLSIAQQRVSELERSVAEKTRQVNELEAEMDRRAGQGAAMAAELKALKTELANAKSDLKKAIAEKDSLLKDLRMTEAELQRIRVQRDMAREDALFNRWQDFLKGSQLEICDRGTRRKLDRCRETSMAALSTPARRDRFAHCVRSGQAAPVIMELEKGAEMPDFSEMLDEEQRATRGWMIVYCDPTLPETAQGRLAERHLPGAVIAEPPPEPAQGEVAEGEIEDDEFDLDGLPL